MLRVPWGGPESRPGKTMVQMLASHAAGYRLLRIIVLLFIPIAYLGFELGADTLHERTLARANRDGTSLLGLTFPIMVDATSGVNVPQKRKVLLEQGPALAASAGVAHEFEQLELVLSRAKTDKSSLMQAGTSLMTAIGAGSGMNQNGNREANALSAASTQYMPKLLVVLNKFNRQTENVMADPQNAAMKMNSLLFTAGELDSTAREFADAVSEARGQSEMPSDYAVLLQKASSLVFDASHLKSLVLPHDSSQTEMMHSLDSALVVSTRQWSEGLMGAWGAINARLDAISVQRHSILTSWMYRTIAISVGAIALGLGTAISMFRSTLRELDDVEHARKDANSARIEAESAAADLAKLNEGMAIMNTEISNNMKMLKSAQDQLVKKGRMEQMGQLTATIAHELRNPLGAVRTSAFLLERKTRGKELGIEGQIQRINNGITRCDDIITQLLDFSRSKQVVTNMEDFDHWLERVVAEEAQKLPAAVSISCMLGLDHLNVPFDPSRMQRAVTNLLANASEAMVGNGDDPARFAVAEPEISVVTRREGDDVLLIVSDNGPGISPENLSRIREPLFTTKSFGTGLGLPAVEQIVVQHGGLLKVESEVGKGASFTIRLPLQEQKELAA
jgi:signal transduction histidine kinase